MRAVDEQLGPSARHAAGALADQLDQLAGNHDASRNPAHVLLADHHAAHIHHSDPAVAVTRLRGTQVGLFHRGWHLDVDLTRYLAAHALARTVPDDHLADALKRLLTRRDPRATAAALLCLLDVPRHQVADIAIVDVTVDGGHLRRYGQWEAVPASARRHLAAARAARLLDGAAPGDPLYPWPHHPPYPRHIREATSDVLTRLGISTRTEIIHADVTDSRRPSEPLRHLGLTLSQLPDAAVDTYAGPAPRSSGPSKHIGPGQRILADPGHTRRLTGSDAVVLRAAVRQRPPAVRRIPAVDTARINLRAAGLMTGNSATAPTLYSLALAEDAVAP